MPLDEILPELVLLGGALALVLLAAFTSRERQGLCAWGALGLLAAAAVPAVAGLSSPSRLVFAGSYAVDGVTGWGRILILAATGLAVVLAPEWLRTDRRHGEYYGVLLLSALGAVLLAGASDTLELVVALLLSAVTGYTLAAYHRGWSLSVEAGMKFFLIGALANTFLLLGVVLLFGLVGTTPYAETAVALAEGVDRSVLVVAVAGIAVGLCFEIAAVPAHAWMPDVSEGAPAPAAAFLTVVPKIGATIAFARFVHLLPETAVGWRTLVALLAAATMTLGNLAALRQDDVRRLLGWSTVSQSGYALMAVVVLGRSDQALPALLFFLAGYAAANGAAFGAVAELRGRTALEDYRGLSRERPLAAAVLAVALLSLVGIPPLAGFVGKLLLFSAALDGGYAWLAALAVANTVVSLFYYLRVLSRVYFDRAPAPVAVLGPWARFGMCAAGALTLGLGLAAETLLGVFPSLRFLP